MIPRKLVFAGDETPRDFEVQIWIVHFLFAVEIMGILQASVPFK